MTEHTPSPVPCPDDFPESRIAALIWDSSDDEAAEHTRRCAACAEAYLDHLVISRTAFEIAGGADERPETVRRPGLLHRFRALPLAAAVLIAVGGIATAAATLYLRPAVVPPNTLDLGRVFEMRARARCDIDGAGLGPNAVLHKWCKFVAGDRGFGNALVAQEAELGPHHVVGFGPDGRVLWKSSDWSDWKDVLGLRGLNFKNIANVVGYRDGDDLRETLGLFFEGWAKSGVVLIDPQSGARKGMYLHAGPLISNVHDSEHILVMPKSPTPERRLLVFGQHGFASGKRPCASVLEGDGRLVQHVYLPAVGIAGLSGSLANACRVDWSPGHESVEMRTSEGLHVRFGVTDGLLDTADVRVSFSDAFERNYDESTGQEGAHVGWFTARGGRSGAGELLAGQVETDTPRTLRNWTGR